MIQLDNQLWATAKKTRTKKRYPGCLAHVVSGTFHSVAANRRQPNLSKIEGRGGREREIHGDVGKQIWRGELVYLLLRRKCLSCDVIISLKTHLCKLGVILLLFLVILRSRVLRECRFIEWSTNKFLRLFVSNYIIRFKYLPRTS